MVLRFNKLYLYLLQFSLIQSLQPNYLYFQIVCAANEIEMKFERIFKLYKLYYYVNPNMRRNACL
jgi:hypothetical protein